MYSPCPVCHCRVPALLLEAEVNCPRCETPLEATRSSMALVLALALAGSELVVYWLEGRIVPQVQGWVRPVLFSAIYSVLYRVIVRFRVADRPLRLDL